MEREPGVRAALADAAVGDDLLIRTNALACVALAQFVSRLEGAVRLIDSLQPWHVLGARDRTGALCRFGQAGRREYFTRELSGRANVDEHGVSLADRRLHFR